MFRTDGILLHSLQERRCLLFRLQGKEARRNQQQNTRCLCSATHLPQLAAQLPETRMLPEQAKQQARGKHQIARIGNVPPRHVTIDRQHRPLLVTVERGLEEAVAFHIQYIIHIDLLAAHLPVCMHQQYALKRRRTG
ncbi:hypothetical protein Barb7_01509 [Bacteroidales bacterium Barb7]|nr:hypothetical protein Barb7_01509 [Bacteroidales bacterium Barb7]